MAWIYSCCWTDHSNGCPSDDVAWKGDPRQYDLDWIEAKVRRGYRKPMSPEDLTHRLDTLERWRVRDEKQSR